MTKSSHIHKFKKLRYKSGNEVFFCVLDCPFKISSSLALGKRTICWRCGNVFVMNDYSLRLAKPHCESCHKPKGMKTEEFNDIKETVEAIIPSMSLSDRMSALRGSKQEDEDI